MASPSLLLAGASHRLTAECGQWWRVCGCGGLEEEACAADSEREGGRGMVADRVALADTNRVVAVAEAR